MSMKFLTCADCTLEFEWIRIVNRYQPARRIDAFPGVKMPHHRYPYLEDRKRNYISRERLTRNQTSKKYWPPWIFEQPVIKPAETNTPVRIGLDDSFSQFPNYLVRAYASIKLDRASDAKEYHKIFFTAEQWDSIASAVHKNEKVILVESSIYYDPDDNPVVVDTRGNETTDDDQNAVGVHKKYIPGIITDVPVISIVHRYHMAFRNGQCKSMPIGDLFLKSFHELYEECSHVDMNEYTDVAEDDDEVAFYYDKDCDREIYWEPEEPSLSDYYDDLEELELNTRGDGFD